MFPTKPISKVSDYFFISSKPDFLTNKDLWKTNNKLFHVTDNITNHDIKK